MNVQQIDYASYLKKMKWNDLNKFVGKIIKSDPRLNALYGEEIRKYSKQQLTDIVASIAQIQRNRIIKEKDKKAKEPYDTTKQKQNWDNFYNDYYKTRNNSIFQGVKLLYGGINNKFTEDVLQALTTFGIQDKIFFNPNTQQLEIFEPNKKGTGGLKLTMKKLIELIGLNTTFYKKVNENSLNGKFQRQRLNALPEYYIIKQLITGLNNLKSLKRKKKIVQQFNAQKHLTKNKLITSINNRMYRYLNNEKYRDNIDQINNQLPNLEPYNIEPLTLDNQRNFYIFDKDNTESNIQDDIITTAYKKLGFYSTEDLAEKAKDVAQKKKKLNEANKILKNRPNTIVTRSRSKQF